MEQLELKKAAEFERKNEVNTITSEEVKTPLEPVYEPLNENDILTEEMIDAMEIEQLKEELTKREIKFTHNTGVAKLKERLKDAVNG